MFLFIQKPIFILCPTQHVIYELPFEKLNDRLHFEMQTHKMNKSMLIFHDRLQVKPDAAVKHFGALSKRNCNFGDLIKQEGKMSLGALPEDHGYFYFEVSLSILDGKIAKNGYYLISIGMLRQKEDAASDYFCNFAV